MHQHLIVAGKKSSHFIKRATDKNSPQNDHG